MTESALQEIEFSFAGKSWRLRPEFKTLILIEATLGQAARPLGLKVINGEASITEIAGVLFCLLRDQKNGPSREEIGEAIMEEGYWDLNVPIGQYLLRAIRGSREHEKEALAKRKAAENPPTPPSSEALTS